MPMVSKYKNQQVETIMQELQMVLLKHQCPVDLSLLALGNLTTHLLQTQVPPSQAPALAASFAAALTASMKSASH